ncbi:MAG: signal peptidase II [Clostridia bacterium]|nr:signal peptidase II [Clostridia bacterium]
MEFVLMGLVLLLDQLSKIWAAASLQTAPFVLIPGALELTYVENRGAVWGMMQGGRVVFLLVTVVFLCFMGFFFARQRKNMSTLTRVILALLVSGALGNMIDRLFLGYVRDMVYVRLINFPVFNVADSAICIAAGLLIWETLFKKKDTTFDLLEKTFSKKEQS